MTSKICKKCQYLSVDDLGNPVCANADYSFESGYETTMATCRHDTKKLPSLFKKIKLKSKAQTLKEKRMEIKRKEQEKLTKKLEKEIAKNYKKDNPDNGFIDFDKITELKKQDGWRKV